MSAWSLSAARVLTPIYYSASLPEAKGRKQDDLFYALPDGSIVWGFWSSNHGWLVARLKGAGTIHPLSTIATVSRDRNYVNIFRIGNEGKVYQSWRVPDSNPIAWEFSKISDLAAKPGYLAATSMYASHQEVFWTSSDGSVQHAYWTSQQNAGKSEPRPGTSGKKCQPGTPLGVVSRDTRKYQWTMEGWRRTSSGSLVHFYYYD
ncbi:hypothetical protein GQ53DRAFT_836658 [Thozetella sp. PMI_491]|nr:hypothetical protein GQ53DRAFT_836658 [Thozetella sp. PMI_491]